MTTSTQNNLDNFNQALLQARQMQDNWLQYGVNFVDLYVDDIEGDWLETWAEDEQEKETVSQIWVNTSQWLQGIFTEGWQSLESLLGENQLNFATSLRSQQEVLDNNIKAIKLINISNYQIILFINCQVLEENKLGVVIQLHSVGDNSFLPANLELSLVDEDDNLVQESVMSREQDNIIQLKRFKAVQSTKFKVKINCKNTILIEQLTL